MHSQRPHSSDSDSQHARRRRGSGGCRPPGNRKERVLHTRVSEQLSDVIRRFAEDLRVPASNLVRNVLEEVFSMVDSVSEDVGELFDDLLKDAEDVRDRVREQASSTRRRSARGAHRRHRRRRSGSDHDIEDELQRDEATESASYDETVRSRAGTQPSAASESGPGAASSEPLPPAELFPEVLGWQPLVLNRDLDCGRCAKRLGAGESAFLGVGAKGLTEIALCGRCAARR
jgi:hypothetical protein